MKKKPDFYCPHMPNGNTDLFGDGHIIYLSNEAPHNLILCGVCWSVVRAAAYDDAIRIAAIAAKQSK